MLVIDEEHLETAEEFLDALHPRNVRWMPRHHDWIFRGHGDSNWPLRPSAYRPKSWEPFGGFDPTTEYEEFRLGCEIQLLQMFAEHLDRAGHHLPGATRQQIDALAPSGSVGPWPHWLVELAAFAQHHGVPTRLLDFTRHGPVAAYFAAAEPNEPTEHLCVWAFDTNLFGRGDHSSDRWLTLERVSRWSNPNLHAQDGLFALWSNLELLSFDDIVKERWSPYPKGGVTPVLGRKMLLPRSEAKDLLRLLVYDRISAATMFPSPDGVVRALKEEALHRGYSYGKYTGPLWLMQKRSKR